jgi:ADP-heptose:LPS heptosyltransferase
MRMINTMNKWIMLVRSDAYARSGITFKRGIPQFISQDLHEDLMGTGRFTSVESEMPGITVGVAADAVTPTTVETDGSTIPGIARATGPAGIPSNLLGADNLNGKRVLLRRSGAIGDTIFVVQFAALLKSKFPSARIDVAVLERMAPLCAAFDHIENVITVTESTLADSIWQYDYLIDFAGVIEEHPTDNQDYLKLHCERAGMQWNTDITTLKYPTCSMSGLKDTPAAQTATGILDSCSASFGTPYVVVLMSTSNVLKNMHSGTLKAICESLCRGSIGSDIMRLHVVCIGGAEDNVSSIPAIPGWLTVSTNHDLLTSAAIIAGASVVVGGDTGMLHLARALGVPTVSYWCSTDPKLTTPHVEDSIPCITVQSTEKCSPCGLRRTSRCRRFTGDNPACASGFDVQAILQAIRRVQADSTRRKVESDPNARQVYAPAAMRAISAASAAKIVNGTRVVVGVLVDWASIYTGGSVYMWRLASAIAKRHTCQVFVIVDTPHPVLYKTEGLPDSATLVYDAEYSALNGCIKYDMLIASPQESSRRVAEYKRKVNPDVITMCAVYETPNFVRKYRDGVDATEEFWMRFKEIILGPYIDIIVPISGETKRHLLEWDEGFKNKSIELIKPAINDWLAGVDIDVIRKQSQQGERTDTVVICLATNHTKSSTLRWK